ncbi:MAG TPA: GNAT family protein [Polyangiaceae bacterium]|nr:GNAT family protein [Polyangiaceae bacterium]
MKIRPPRFEDGAELLALRVASRAFLEKWEPRPEGGIDAFGPAWFARFFAASTAERSRRYLVVHEDDGRIVGQVGLGEIMRGALQQAFVGYWAGEAYARRGYLTEGVRLVVCVAFEELGLHRLEANVQPHNEPSLRLLKRLGFRKEGYSPRYLQIAGEWVDHERWALTREEHVTP